MGRFRKLKEEKGAIIGVAGCVAQQEGDRLLDRVPYLDMVIGTHAIPMLPQLVQKVEASGQRVCETGFDPDGKYLKTILSQKADSISQVKSYVTIMQGCDHFCSFCIVPYVRGREKSRPSREIIEEVEHLAEMGVKEVCLLGQNVNGYGKGLKEEIEFSGASCADQRDRRDRTDSIHHFSPEGLLRRTDPGLFKIGEALRTYPSSFSIGFGPNSESHAPRLYTKASYLERIDRLKNGMSFDCQ